MCAKCSRCSMTRASRVITACSVFDNMFVFHRVAGAVSRTKEWKDSQKAKAKCQSKGMQCLKAWCVQSINTFRIVIVVSGKISWCQRGLADSRRLLRGHGTLSGGILLSPGLGVGLRVSFVSAWWLLSRSGGNGACRQGIRTGGRSDSCRQSEALVPYVSALQAGKWNCQEFEPCCILLIWTPQYPGPSLYFLKGFPKSKGKQ